MPASVTRPALVLLVAFTALTGLVYPLLVTGVARLAFPQAANGSLIVRAGTPVASRLIGQNFTGVQYFWGRPSATASYPYNATASGGSNLGPLNPVLADAVRQRVMTLRALDPGNEAPVPVDLVTASGSGLDPEVSLAAIQYQLPRVARARKIATEAMQALVARHSKSRLTGFLGEPRVNVVELNLALDALQGPATADR
jgi:potassium-transporting ATPase KdpC subunit